MPQIKKLLIANRGEIALRIHRACHEMGIKTVAVHSTADADAMHVRLADEAICIGPPPAADSYLNIPNIISAAEITRRRRDPSRLWLPLRERPFAEIVEAHGIIFVGPKPEHIRTMGDKIEAKRTAGALGLPLVPGSDGAISDIAEAKADRRGDRLSGDHQGGLGRRRARHEGRAPTPRTARNADAAGRQRGEGRVRRRHRLSWKNISAIRAISNSRSSATATATRSIWASATARCSAATRRCSRKPPPRSSRAEERERMGGIVAKAMADMGYRGAGTIEFLWEDGEFYFIEMNTRLQVEHPVTEVITGLDLVREQIRIAEGHPLSLRQEDVEFRGHAIECRINAEDPRTFAPSPGLVKQYHAPGGMHVRVDSGLYAGYRVPPYYDCMIAKLIVYGTTRDGALRRLRRALEEFVIEGVKTTIPLHQALLDDPEFQDGRLYDQVAGGVAGEAGLNARTTRRVQARWRRSS